MLGEFDSRIARLRSLLGKTDPHLPFMDAVAQSIIENQSEYDDPEKRLDLRNRMLLVEQIPELQAQITVMYSEWRAVISEFTAQRLGQQPDDLVPLAVGQMAFGAVMAAFSRWAGNPGEDLNELIRRSIGLLDH